MKIETVKKLTPERQLFYWIEEREKIRKLKESGAPKPWTDDVILQSYRFCNVRRMDDKVSVWLNDNWYKPYFNHPNMLYAVAMARFFNKPESLDLITKIVFSDLPLTTIFKRIVDRLREYRDAGFTVFNGAYMVRGNDGVDKIECVVEYYVKPLIELKTRIIDPVGRNEYMEGTWHEICRSYGMGSFMAGQIVADLRHAVNGSWKDRYTWAPMGPGSKRGLNAYLGKHRETNMNQDYFLSELRNMMEEAKKKVSQYITNRLEAHDYQNCLCEYFKYRKTIDNDGKPKQKYQGA